MAEPLLRTAGLTKAFPIGRRRPWEPRRSVHAVDDIDIKIDAGRSLALVGESGSGKTTLGRLIAGLDRPSSGSITIDGVDLATMTRAERQATRRHVQVVFQDPYSSLNPRHSVRTILARPFEVHTSMTRGEVDAQVRELLGLVGLGPADEIMARFPHQFSGGQRQRIVFARAIALRPRFVIADEPVSSLDMSVKAQLLTLLRRFAEELSLTYLFITHELSVVRTIAADVAVMYLGRIVEYGEAARVFEAPLHPYSVALLASTPVLDPRVSRSLERPRLRGTMPSPVDPPAGCHFHTRCPYATEVCRLERPGVRMIGTRQVACHHVGAPTFPTTAALSAAERPIAVQDARPWTGALDATEPTGSVTGR